MKADASFFRRYAQLLLVINILILLWLVWTPSSFVDCEESPSLLDRPFCLPSWLIYAGNFMLLSPTAIFLKIIFPRQRLIVISSEMLLLSCLIEGVQLFVPGRDPDLLDILLNSMGAALALCLFVEIQKMRTI